MATSGYLHATAMGAVAGLRGLTASAVMTARDNRARPALAVLAVGELALHVLPPRAARALHAVRLQPAALVAHIASGAYSGGQAVARAGGRRRTGVLLGALGAAAAALGAHAVRSVAIERGGFSPATIGALGSAIAAGAALAIAHSPSAE